VGRYLLDCTASHHTRQAHCWQKHNDLSTTDCLSYFGSYLYNGKNIKAMEFKNTWILVSKNTTALGSMEVVIVPEGTPLFEIWRI